MGKYIMKTPAKANPIPNLQLNLYYQRTSVGNKIVYQSEVVRESTGGAAPTTSSFPI